MVKNMFEVSWSFEFHTCTIKRVSLLLELSPNVYQNTLQLLDVPFNHHLSRKKEQLIVEICFNKHLMEV